MKASDIPVGTDSSSCPFMCSSVPRVNHFKIFGTATYPFLIPFNGNKLQFRSTQCIFLGYAVGYKVAVCYNL